eukprot:CAMPEP_0178900944 /NCGR_PEP_ID=MMETSP0786-20121207/3745_1 /TAXON_ID=186022 /ORGANISM="Thalassionema frauenfeldii, Strain CCMP 1798" /LENGTH=339 /DNA_ID=CAMNT_0020571985 /DNA_START=278 /DNA_END=1297 /DNA_ORIENTATION=-
MSKELRLLRQKDSLIKAKAFTATKLRSLEVPLDAAPQFQQGIDNYESFETSQRLLSFLAGGRTYQGKLDRLLKDVCPDLVMDYECIVKEVPDKELLKIYVEEKGAADSQLNDSLIKCVEMDFPRAAPQPSDGGRRRGKKGECDLKEYLDGLHSDSSVQILAPVWVRNKSRKPISKRCSNVIQVSPEVDLNGMTTEFDAISVQLQGHSLQIAQVWEAKATLDPTTLYEILTKKYGTIASIFRNPSQLVFNGECYAIANQKMPKLGIFTTRLPESSDAAQLAINVCGESMLDRDSSIIPSALEYGEVTVPREKVQQQLESILHLVQEIQPDFVCPAVSALT